MIYSYTEFHSDSEEETIIEELLEPKTPNWSKVGTNLNEEIGFVKSQPFLEFETKRRNRSCGQKCNRLFKKSMYATPGQVIAASDVHIEQNRLYKIYCVFNFLFYAAQMLVLTLFSSQLFGIGSVLNQDDSIPQSPLYVSLHFYQIGWTVCFALQGFFALRGLTFDRASVHFKNCLMLKIKLNFMLLCALFILSFVFIAFFVNDNNQKLFYAAFIVIANFAILKCK